jgi:hypothetical protein
MTAVVIFLCRDEDLCELCVLFCLMLHDVKMCEQLLKSVNNAQTQFKKLSHLSEPLAEKRLHARGQILCCCINSHVYHHTIMVHISK